MLLSVIVLILLVSNILSGFAMKLARTFLAALAFVAAPALAGDDNNKASTEQ